MKIQNKISQNMLSKKDLKEAMQSIKTDIKDALGE